MSRLAIRTRLTLGFAAVMALVFLALGAFTYLRVESDLDAAVDRGLQSRADDLASLLSENDGKIGDGRKILGQDDRTFVQILLGDGTVYKATRSLPPEPLVTSSQVEDMRGGPVVFERSHPARSDEPVRVIAQAVNADGRERLIVVGSVLTTRDEALSALGRVLVLGGVLGLLLASVAGYLLSRAALRPVEAMRREASSVDESHPERRLPLPRADDELRLLATTLNAMLDRLDTALTRERGFVADASHELRTPLAALKAEVSVALESDGTREDLREALISADGEVDRLAQLAEDLLVIARADRGRLPVRREPVSPAVLLNHLHDRFSRRLTEAGRSLVVEAPADLVVQIDPLRIEQALGNLVDNAIRHGEGEIRCTAVAAEGRIELHVSDEGPGFSDTLAPVAFERFTRGDLARGRGGSGLGLAIVQVIADAHGGEAVLAQTTRGSDVALILPLAHG